MLSSLEVNMLVNIEGAGDFKTHLNDAEVDVQSSKLSPSLYEANANFQDSR